MRQKVNNNKTFKVMSMIVIVIFQELCRDMIFEGLMSVSIIKLQLLWSVIVS